MARRLLALIALLGSGLSVAAILGRTEGRPPGPPLRLAEEPTPAPTPRAARERRLTARAAEPRRPRPRIVWRRSLALGTPSAGRLVRGVRLPARGGHYVTWDPVRKRTPNRWTRRTGTDDLVRTLLRVTKAYAKRHPGAPRIVIGDLSRPRGGDFGRRFGPIGHASHQNGLDADVYFPRKDGKERAPRSIGQIQRRSAQELVDRFVQAGARKVFVGAGLRLRGPVGVVQPWPNHDDHLHVRLG